MSGGVSCINEPNGLEQHLDQAALEREAGLPRHFAINEWMVEVESPSIDADKLLVTSVGTEPSVPEKPTDLPMGRRK